MDVRAHVSAQMSGQDVVSHGPDRNLGGDGIGGSQVVEDRPRHEHEHEFAISPSRANCRTVRRWGRSCP